MESIKKPQYVIPFEMLPPEGIHEIVGRDGKTYLLKNDAMFTAYRHSRAELSEFFLAIRDECRIFGNRCPECQHIIVPPFELLCPPCNFVVMQKEYVKDTGVLAAPPPSIAFPPALFKSQVPYTNGKIYLDTMDGGTTDTYLKLRIRSTYGLVLSDLYKSGTPMKVVFKQERVGDITDLFLVAQSELTAEQVAKSPLFENDITWDRTVEDLREKRSETEHKQILSDTILQFNLLAERVRKSPSAQKDLKHWTRLVEVRLGLSQFFFAILDGTLAVEEAIPQDIRRADTDLVFTVLDDMALLVWLRDAVKGPEEKLEGPALTDLVLDGIIRLNKSEIETVTRLDRIPRSLRRDRTHNT